MKHETREIEFRNFDREKVLRILVKILAEQEGAEVELSIEKIR